MEMSGATRALDTTAEHTSSLSVSAKDRVGRGMMGGAWPPYEDESVPESPGNDDGSAPPKSRGDDVDDDEAAAALAALEGRPASMISSEEGD